MSRVRDESGFTLPELLVAMILMTIVMLATLATLDQFVHTGRNNEQRLDLQQHARDASRTMARALRNIAGSSETADVIERAEPFDLVFKVVDDSGEPAGDNAGRLKRLRYCLDGAAGSSGRIREQVQTWTSPGAPAIPSDPACPGTGWDESRVLAERVTNRAGTGDRPLWIYREANGQVSALSINLLMDDAVAKPPAEVALRTGIFLRNQNRPPLASFTATPAGVTHLLLNGSASYDPEGHPIDMVWTVDGTKIGEGVNLDWDAEERGTYTITLEVSDPSGLSASASQTVAVQ